MAACGPPLTSSPKLPHRDARRDGLSSGSALDEGGQAFAEREIKSLLNILQETLADDFFVDISPATLVPMSSSVLQRRSGYREILQAWLKFESVARLIWSGGEEVFGGGQRDVAMLYEYWLFFVLRRALISISKKKDFLGDTSNILEVTKDGFSLKLRTGELLAQNRMNNK
jgi:predicted component of viral defense system (DUF524 family)